MWNTELFRLGINLDDFELRPSLLRVDKEVFGYL